MVFNIIFALSMAFAADVVIVSTPLTTFESKKIEEHPFRSFTKGGDGGGIYAYVRGCGQVQLFTNSKKETPEKGKSVKMKVKNCTVDDWTY